MADIKQYYADRGVAERDISVNYEDLLEVAGLVVTRCKYFGWYQGDAFAIVTAPDGKQGVSVWGYGSCSGCDQLQDDMPRLYAKDTPDWTAINNLVDQMKQEVKWPAEGEDVRALCRRMGDAASNTDWYVYDPEMRDYLLAMGEETGPILPKVEA